MSSFRKILAIAYFLSGLSLAQAQVSAPIPAFTPYTQQCTVCHNAYPPGMLSAVAWQKLIEDMPAHFDGSVMVNVVTQNEISDWLQQNVRAGSRPRPAATPHQPKRLVAKHSPQ